VYGSTEAEPIAAIDHADVGLSDLARMRDGGGLLVGRPVEGLMLRILRHPLPVGRHSLTGDELDRLSASTGEIGEIAVAGPHVLHAYADAEQEAPSKFDVDGQRWHRTGDAGYLDERGRLWLAGRAGAAIRDPRGTVYPFQVEMAAESAAGVRRAALLAVAGQRVLAIERRRGSLDCARIARCVAQQTIDRVVVLRRIPVDRRHNAKVDYAALRRRLDGSGSPLLERFVELMGTVVGSALRLVRRARLRCRASRAA